MWNVLIELEGNWRVVNRHPLTCDQAIALFDALSDDQQEPSLCSVEYCQRYEIS